MTLDNSGNTTTMEKEKGNPGARKKIIVLLAGVLAVLIIGLNVYRVALKDVVKVKTAAVKQETLAQTVLATGRVSACEKEVFLSQATGSVKKLHVRLGQEVNPGQLLMELDIPDAGYKVLQAESVLARAESDLASARAHKDTPEVTRAEFNLNQMRETYRLASENLSRSLILYQEGVISREEMQKLESELKIQEARLLEAEAGLKGARAGADAYLQSLESSAASARASLENLRKQTAQEGVRARIAGRVLSLPVRSGDLISVNSHLCTVGNLQRLEIIARINEADAPLVKNGQKVLVTQEYDAGRRLYGKVTETGLELVSQIESGAEVIGIPVVISMNEGANLLPGATVDLEIEATRKERVLTIPLEAVKDVKGEPCVFKVKNGTAFLQRIEAGASDSFKIEVQSGLKKGDLVVMTPPAELKSGSRVRL